MKWLLLGTLLAACEPKMPIGANGPDGSVDVTGDGGGDGSLSCSSCDATSCGSRVCGRSDCGFLCGTCASDEICLLGVSCNDYTGQFTPCIDAFGDPTSSLDVGFRTCPTDPSKQQACQCDGATGEWINCDMACVELCTQPAPGTANITCGSSACSGGDVCCISQGDLDVQICTAGACAANQHTRACDGPEDCAPGMSCCGGNQLVPVTATCTAGASCGSDEQYCHTAADCPASASHCCPAIIMPEVSMCSPTSC